MVLVDQGADSKFDFVCVTVVDSEKEVNGIVQGLEEDRSEFLFENFQLDFDRLDYDCFGSLLEDLDKLSGIGLGRFEVLAASNIRAGRKLKLDPG